MAISLNSVRSYVYLVGSHIPVGGYAAAIGASPVDMIIAGEGEGDTRLDRSVADPTGTKLILGYVDASEANASAYPNLISGSSVPSWFGKPNPMFPDNYTVQFWTPQWETALFGRIDQLVKAGYDGIFIDQLSGDAQWLAGNPENNPVHSTAVADMAKLITDIRAHITGLHLAKPFYLLGNNPTEVIRDFPTALTSLDGIFNELVYWQPLDTNPFTSAFVGNQNYNYLMNTLAPTYKSLGLTVFGNDYPNPTGNLQADFQSFALYTSLGWTPSIQNAFQNTDVLSTGPFMYMAVQGNTTVQGAANFVNFISGGVQPSADLTGGDLGDFFIGGPGKNVIHAGAGDDTIYAHPAAAGLLNMVELKLTMALKGTVGFPQVQVKINGQVAGLYTITSDYTVIGYQPQVIDIAVKSFGPITSIEVDAVNVKWVTSTNFNTLNINSISYAGTSMAMTQAALSGSSQLVNGNTAVLLNQTGVAKWTTIPAQPTLNTSDTIDGGAGTNTVVYRAALSHYAISRNADGSLHVVSSDTAEGPDDLYNVQKLQFADQTINASTIPLSVAADRTFTLQTSQAWTTTIAGGAGNDALTGAAGPEYLNGAAGSDTMTGAGGDDTFQVDQAGDVVVEGANGGIDTVLSTIASFTLPANVENLKLTGTIAQAGTGNALNNILTANDVDSTLNGGAGSDILIAGAGKNVLTGGTGADMFLINKVPSSPVEITDFTPGADTLDLRGLFATNSYRGTDPVKDGYLKFVADGAGNTRVMYDADGGAGAGAAVQIALLDKISPAQLAPVGDWTWTGGVSPFVVSSTANSLPPTPDRTFTLQTSQAFTTTIAGGTGNDVLTGTGGAEYLNGGGGTDTLTGAAGDDSYLVYTDASKVTEAANGGIDTVTAYATNVTLSANVENLTLIGASSQTGVGNALNNILIANDVNATLNGMDGNDILVSGAGKNVLTGGTGADIFRIAKVPASPVEVTDFTVGTDVLDVRGLFSAIGYAGSDPVRDGYLKFVADGLGNTKVMYDADGSGPAAAVQIALLDRIDPTKLSPTGDFTWTGGATPFAVSTTTNSPPPTPDRTFTLQTSQAFTTTINGGAGNDALAGTGGAEYLNGGGGTDTLTGAAGDDSYLVYTDASVVVEGANGGIDTVTAYANNTTLSANVENLKLIGTQGQTGTGNALNNILTANDGVSTLNGMDGNDILVAGAGKDVLTGGLGADIFQINKVASTPVEITDFTIGTDVLDVRGLFATLSYSGTDPLKDGWIKFSSDGAGATRVYLDPDGAAGTAAPIQIALLDKVDPTKLSPVGDWTWTGGAAPFVVSSTVNSAPPTPDRTFTLQTTQAWTSSLVGGTGNDVLTGNAGPEYINGAGGVDTLTGAAGDDTFLVYTDASVAVEGANGGIDTVTAYANNTTLSANVENLTLIGTQGQTGVGNTLNNILTANDGVSTLSGMAGNDVLISGAGKSVLTGGAGSDIFRIAKVPTTATEVTDFTLGTDVLDLRPLFAGNSYAGTDPVKDGYLKFVASGANTQVMFDADGAAGSGAAVQVALLDGIDPLKLSPVGDWTWKGGAAAFAVSNTPSIVPSHLFTVPASATPTNSLFGADTGVSLTGTSAADSLAGGSGADTLTGLAGDDTYLVNRDADVVVEASGAGIDTVRSYANNTTLSANVENLVLIGTQAQVGVGNGLNNILTANNANSNLNGGLGNDLLIAGTGVNVLTGGAGQDIFQISKIPSSSVEITDFAVGTDILDIRGLFASTGYKGTDPVKDGYLKFVADGAGNTKVMFDADGAGSGAAVQVALLDQVADPTALKAGWDWAYV